MPATLEIHGKQYVVIERAEYDQLREAASADATLPPLPKILPSGNRPAAETMRVIMARRIIAARTRAAVSQAELARLSGVRVENLNRIEKARVMPDEKTVVKLEKALSKKGQKI
jgi:ribosome-binding protein aMBF1 (putative translation factor)